RDLLPFGFASAAGAAPVSGADFRVRARFVGTAAAVPVVRSAASGAAVDSFFAAGFFVTGRLAAVFGAVVFFAALGALFFTAGLLALLFYAAAFFAGVAFSEGAFFALIFF